MADTEKSKRKVWTKDETLLFLSCYRARKEEFAHPRKKRGAYANVLEDMIWLGFGNTNITADALEGKMRTLLSAYKCAKDNTKQTGAGSCLVPYFTEMDEIYGDKPIISNVHSLNFGGRPTAALVEPQNFRQFEEQNDVPEHLPANSPDLSPLSPLPSSRLNASAAPVRVQQTDSTPLSSRKRKTAKEKYYDGKLECKRKQVEIREEYYKKIKVARREG